MSVLSVSDIVALAKQGYKKDDIKELIELSKSESHEDETSQGDTPEESHESDVTTQEDSKPTDTPESDETIDYKKLYDEEHQKVLNLQKNNTHQKISGDEKSDDDIVNELFKNLK